jgi:hypothetical protein
MSTTKLKGSPGEHIFQVEPSPQTYVEAGWRSRPHLYTNRGLSAEALAADQHERSGWLALRGQSVSPGVVSGLEVQLRFDGYSYYFDLSPGLGLTFSGEDVVIPLPHSVRVGSVPAYVPTVMAEAGFSLDLLASLKAATTQQNLRAAVLVLVPVVSHKDDPPDPNDPSEIDPDDYAFLDQQLVDGCALVLFGLPWDKEQELPDLSTPTGRNLMAWRLFEEEQQRPHGEPAPWEKVGVPLALVGFQTAIGGGGPATPFFVDRAAVVRAGGAPRSRTPLLPQHGSPLLWQARSQQFAEHLESFSREDFTEGRATAAFEYLPPVGTLPKHTFDPFEWRTSFFPVSFILEAVPVPLEQLDALALTSASLAPLRTSAQEHVRVLAPVPQEHFDPHLLQNELLDPAFHQAIASALLRLGDWLWRREDLRKKASVLRNALEGPRANWFPEPDPTIAGEKKSLGPLNPPESNYGTEGDTVPAIEEVLTRNSSWDDPSWLGSSTLAVTTLKVPETTTHGELRFVLSYPHSVEDRSIRLILRRLEGSTQIQEVITYETSYENLRKIVTRLLWIGGMPVIVLYMRARGSNSVSLGYQVAPNTWKWNWQPLDLSLVSAVDAVAMAVEEDLVHAFATGMTEDGSFRIEQVTWGVKKATTSPPAPPDVEPKGKKPLLESLHEVLPDQLVAIHRGEGELELLYLGRDSTSPEGWLHHVSSANGNLPTEQRHIKGNHLTACLSHPFRVDVLVTNGGIRHARYNVSDKTWTPSSNPEDSKNFVVVNPRGGSLLTVVSGGKDGQLHAFWWDALSKWVMYRRFDGTAWQPLEILHRESPKTSSVGIHATVDAYNQLDVIIQAKALPQASTSYELLHLRKNTQSTREAIKNNGFRRVIESINALQQRTRGFTLNKSKEAEAEIQHIRKLMLGSSTDASRLAVSARYGNTLVDSPLALQNDLNHYITHFQTRTRIARIRLSASMEALREATEIRRAQTAEFFALVKELRKVKEIGLDLKGMYLLGIMRFAATGFRKASLINRRSYYQGWGTTTRFVDRENIPVLALVDDPNQLQSVLDRISSEPEAIERALSSYRPIFYYHRLLRWTESDYFSTSIRHMENMLVLLRDLERRMSTRTRTVENYKAALNQMDRIWGELDKRLKAVDSEVAEARQDVTVGRALLAEELVRIDTINARRRQVFEQHVPFFVFQRPRQSELTAEAPLQRLDTAIVEDTIGEVFASTAAAPPELLAYIELVRDSPLKWFVVAPQLLPLLDRAELVVRTFQWAHLRAVQRIPVQLPVVSGRTYSTQQAQGLAYLMATREDSISRWRNSFLHYPTSYFHTQSWVELQQSAHAHLSLSDFIDMAHGRADVSGLAAKELEHISKVATGLYQRFGQVLPAIRLQWAEQMSQYDTPVNLRNLSRLPQWEQLDVSARQELQQLVDWLFGRVVGKEPEAVSLMNDLVRVCMLLASHAPINELLSGHVSKPTVAQVGGTIELAVDPSRVRIGMHVVVRSGQQTVEAVVVDMTSSAVRARVLSASSPMVHLAERASARFSDPVRGPGPYRPGMGAMW